MTAHDQRDRMGHANPGLIVAAVACEWVSMVSFARMQRRLLLGAGEHLAIGSAVGIAFAGNAVSVSVPVAGSGLGTAYSYRQFRRHRVSDAAAALALLVSGVLSTLTLMAVMAAGALMSGNTAAGVLGALWAAACVAGMAGLVFGLRKPAWRRFMERMAVGAIRAVQRFRHAPGQPEAVVASVVGGSRGQQPLPHPGRGGHRRCGAGSGAGQSPGAHGGRGRRGSHLPADQPVAGLADRVDSVLLPLLRPCPIRPSSGGNSDA